MFLSFFKHSLITTTQLLPYNNCTTLYSSNSLLSAVSKFGALTARVKQSTVSQCLGYFRPSAHEPTAQLRPKTKTLNNRYTLYIYQPKEHLCSLYMQNICSHYLLPFLWIEQIKLKNLRNHQVLNYAINLILYNTVK